MGAHASVCVHDGPNIMLECRAFFGCTRTFFFRVARGPNFRLTIGILLEAKHRRSQLTTLRDVGVRTALAIAVGCTVVWGRTLDTLYDMYVRASPRQSLPEVFARLPHKKHALDTKRIIVVGMPSRVEKNLYLFVRRQNEPDRELTQKGAPI